MCAACAVRSFSLICASKWYFMKRSAASRYSLSFKFHKFSSVTSSQTATVCSYHSFGHYPSFSKTQYTRIF
jgi:hypothetical protein